jgi:hypothetical protein
VGKDISIAPVSEDYLSSYVLKHTYGEKIDIDRMLVRAKGCGDNIKIGIQALDFGDIHNKTYTYRKDYESFLGDVVYDSVKDFSIKGMCNESFKGSHEIIFTNDFLPSKEIKWIVSCEEPVAAPEFIITGPEEQETKCGEKKNLSFEIKTNNIEKEDLPEYKVFYFYGYVNK